MYVGYSKDLNGKLQIADHYFELYCMATYVFSSKSFVMHNQKMRLCMHGSVKFIGGHKVLPFNQGWSSPMCGLEHIYVACFL